MVFPVNLVFKMAHLIRIILPVMLVFLAYQTLGKSQDASTRYFPSRDIPIRDIPTQDILTSEETLSRVVKGYLMASHSYILLDVAMNNMDWELASLKTFLRKQSDEKRDRALKLIEYQNRRGGNVTDINLPGRPEGTYYSPFQIVEESFQIEMELKGTILDIHLHLRKKKDVEFAQHLISHLERQTEIISEIQKIRKHISDPKSRKFSCSVIDKFMC